MGEIGGLGAVRSRKGPCGRRLRVTRSIGNSVAHSDDRNGPEPKPYGQKDSRREDNISCYQENNQIRDLSRPSNKRVIAAPIRVWTQLSCCGYEMPSLPAW